MQDLCSTDPTQDTCLKRTVDHVGYTALTVVDHAGQEYGCPALKHLVHDVGTDDL